MMLLDNDIQNIGTVMKVKNITFDPVPHTYTDEDGHNYKSVTTFLSEFEEDFDVEYWSMWTSLKRSCYKCIPNTEERLIGIKKGRRIDWYSLPALYVGVVPLKVNPFDVRKEWEEKTEESCIWGTDRHNHLEDSINAVYKTQEVKIQDIETTSKDYRYKITDINQLDTTPLKGIPTKIYERLKVYITNGWTLYAEKRVYSSVHFIAGTTDLLLVKNKQIIILDWKTNKHKIEFRSGYYKKEWNEKYKRDIKTSNFVENNDRFKFPIKHIPKSKGNGYTLQLSTYAYMWELWGFQVKAIVLCHIRPKLGDDMEPILINNKRVELPPEFYSITYRKADIRKLFNYRLKQLKNAS